MNSEEYIRARLFEMQDLKYRDFHSRLMPEISKELVIGVRVPDLRRLAKELSQTSYASEFINVLPHRYYEENNLHAFLIEGITDYSECISRINDFLPFVDNWATCDSLRPKIFSNHLPELLCETEKWLSSEHTYAVRFGVEMLMCHFLDDNFSVDFPKRISEIRSDEYYVKMMLAWYFATALSKQYELVIPFIEQKKLDTETHNKAIQKAIESRRISDDKKKYLRTLKRK